MNAHCPQNVWNHTHGCTCTAIVSTAPAPAGTSVFGSLSDTETASAAVAVVERPHSYASVDMLPPAAQDYLFVQAMNDVAERHFGRRMTSHEYDDLVDEVQERSEQILDEDYDEVMERFGLDGRDTVTSADEVAETVLPIDVDMAKAKQVTGYSADGYSLGVHRLPAYEVIATTLDGTEVVADRDMFVVTDSAGRAELVAYQSEALRTYANFVTSDTVTHDPAVQAATALEQASRLERRGL